MFFLQNSMTMNISSFVSNYTYRATYKSIAGQVRELLPVFDAAGFTKIPPPTSKTMKPGYHGEKR